MKTAIIFGASRGIGAEIAKEFAHDGYYVVINYYSSEIDAKAVLEEIKAEGGDGITLKANIANYDEVENMVKHVASFRKSIDVAVVSAGIAKNDLLIDASIEDINNVINTNLVGTIYACKSIAKEMLPNHSGKIITIASMWGECGASMESIYSASKGGIIAFTKALAKELGYNGINVNCISPGLIDTQMNAHLSKEDIQALIDETPSSRIGTPTDIAKAALWLASDAASFVNGHVLSINGGFVI